MANVTVDYENIRIDLVPGAADTRRAMTMGEAAVIGRAVRIAADGALEQTNATTVPGVSGQIGLIVASARSAYDGVVNEGETVTALLSGPVYLGEDANLDPTKLYYLSGDAGRITDVKPANARPAGYPLTPTIFNFQPAAELPDSV